MGHQVCKISPGFIAVACCVYSRNGRLSEERCARIAIHSSLLPDWLDRFVYLTRYHRFPIPRQKDVWVRISSCASNLRSCLPHKNGHPTVQFRAEYCSRWTVCGMKVFWSLTWTTYSSSCFTALFSSPIFMFKGSSPVGIINWNLKQQKISGKSVIGLRHVQAVSSWQLAEETNGISCSLASFEFGIKACKSSSIFYYSILLFLLEKCNCHSLFQDRQIYFSTGGRYLIHKMALFHYYNNNKSCYYYAIILLHRPRLLASWLIFYQYCSYY